MPEEFNNGNDTNNKIKIDNLLNSSSSLEESIELSREKPLDSKFLRDFLESDSSRSSPVNHNELSSKNSPQCPPSAPSNSRGSSIASNLSFNSRSPS